MQHPPFVLYCGTNSNDDKNKKQFLMSCNTGIIIIATFKNKQWLRFNIIKIGVAASAS